MPCAKCTHGDKSHKPHDRPACPNLNNHDPNVSQFLVALDGAVGTAIQLSESFQAAVATEEARLKGARAPRPGKPAGSMSGRPSNQVTLSFISAVKSAQKTAPCRTDHG